MDGASNIHVKKAIENIDLDFVITIAGITVRIAFIGFTATVSAASVDSW
jgi:hypothetical protein